MVLTRSLRREARSSPEDPRLVHLRARATRGAAQPPGLVSGLIAWGYNPVTNISHARVSATHALCAQLRRDRRVRAPVACDRRVRRSSSRSPPETAQPRSSARSSTHSPRRRLGGLVHLDFFKHYLLSDQFDGWHGLFRAPYLLDARHPRPSGCPCSSPPCRSPPPSRSSSSATSRANSSRSTVGRRGDRDRASQGRRRNDLTHAGTVAARCSLPAARQLPERSACASRQQRSTIAAFAVPDRRSLRPTTNW